MEPSGYKSWEQESGNKQGQTQVLWGLRPIRYGWGEALSATPGGLGSRTDDGDYKEIMIKQVCKRCLVNKPPAPV